MKRRRKIGRTIVIAGILAVLAAGGILAYNTQEEYQAGRRAARIEKALSERIRITKLEVSPFTEPSPGEEDGPPAPAIPEYIEMDGQQYLGVLRIPRLSLELPVNSVLTDETLKASACRYAGGFSGGMVISAHNYRRHFGGLPRLSRGDSVTITDAGGYEHQYVVDMTETLHETEVDAMINTPYDLTLFTCTLSRTERFTVRCTRVSPNVPDPELSASERPAATAAPPTEPPANAPNAPRFRIDYRNETLEIKRGHLYSIDGGVSYTEVTETVGVTLDVSGCVTYGTPIYVQKAATNTRPASKTQVIRPAARAALESRSLPVVNGKLTLDRAYEVYRPSANRWGNLPRITENTEFEIRLKNTAKTSGGDVTGHAASLPGKLIVTYGEYAPGKRGVLSAEIAAP
jgi:sortase A